MTLLHWLLAIPARCWRAAFAVGNLRLWAIILGAPPLCFMAGWVIDILAGLAVHDEPVREPVVKAIAYMGFGILALVGIIVVALATVKVRATTPAGSLDIGAAGETFDTQSPAHQPED